MMYQKLAKTYAEIAKSRTVAEKTLKELQKDNQLDKFLKKNYSNTTARYTNACY
nr:hypothetical protein [Thermobrachium celere]